MGILRHGLAWLAGGIGAFMAMITGVSYEDAQSNIASWYNGLVEPHLGGRLPDWLNTPVADNVGLIIAAVLISGAVLYRLWLHGRQKALSSAGLPLSTPAPPNATVSVNEEPRAQGLRIGGIKEHKLPTKSPRGEHYTGYMLHIINDDVLRNGCRCVIEYFNVLDMTLEAKFTSEAFTLAPRERKTFRVASLQRHNLISLQKRRLEGNKTYNIQITLYGDREPRQQTYKMYVANRRLIINPI